MTTQRADLRINFDDLRSLLRDIFLNNGTSIVVADILAANCAGCERDGAASHGIFRIPGYLTSLETGWVDGRAQPDVIPVSPSFIRIDARNGFAQPALAAGVEAIKTAVTSTGVAIIAIRNSHHFSALWPDVEPFARGGLLALTFVNGLANVVPHGGHAPVYGTNPIAFAAPVADAEPLVVDQATSVMPTGRSDFMPLQTARCRQGPVSTAPEDPPSIRTRSWRAERSTPSAATRGRPLHSWSSSWPGR